eukprot:m.98431 g.98431  ORF g.98431 m.98431 type:complete len:268 (+) comp12519_c1_seq2:440-1243(+)
MYMYVYIYLCISPNPPSLLCVHGLCNPLIQRGFFIPNKFSPMSIYSACTSVSVHTRTNAVCATGTELKVLKGDDSGSFTVEEFGQSHRGATLLSSEFMDSNTIVTGSNIGIVEVWDRRDPKQAVTVMRTSVCEDGSLQVLNAIGAHTLDGNIVCSGDDEGLVVFYDRRQPSLPLAQIQPHTAPVWDISFSKENPHILFTAGEDGQVLHWNTNVTQATTKTTFSITNNSDEMTVTDINTSTPSVNSIATADGIVVCGNDECDISVIAL